MLLEIKVDLPETLAEEAKSKGLLDSAAFERMLREELKRRNQITNIDPLSGTPVRLLYSRPDDDI